MTWALRCTHIDPGTVAVWQPDQAADAAAKAEACVARRTTRTPCSTPFGMPGWQKVMCAIRQRWHVWERIDPLRE